MIKARRELNKRLKRYGIKNQTANNPAYRRAVLYVTLKLKLNDTQFNKLLNIGG